MAREFLRILHEKMGRNEFFPAEHRFRRNFAFLPCIERNNFHKFSFQSRRSPRFNFQLFYLVFQFIINIINIYYNFYLVSNSVHIQSKLLLEIFNRRNKILYIVDHFQRT